MKNILEKYSDKADNKGIIKEEEEGDRPQLPKIEDAARKLQASISNFLSLTKSLPNNNDHFKQALSYLKGAYKKLPHYMALEMVGESIEVGAEDLSKMNDREVRGVEDIAKRGGTGIKVVKENHLEEDKYVATAKFYVFVERGNSPGEKATELLYNLEYAQDGASPRLISLEPVKQRQIRYESVRELSKDELLNEIAAKRKGYIYKESLDKHAFLNKLMQ